MRYIHMYVPNSKELLYRLTVAKLVHFSSNQVTIWDLEHVSMHGYIGVYAWL